MYFSEIQVILVYRYEIPQEFLIYAHLTMNEQKMNGRLMNIVLTVRDLPEIFLV